MRAVSTSKPLVGSSKMMTSGSCTSDITRLSFCFMPVLRLATFTSANLSMPKRLNMRSLRTAVVLGSTPCSWLKKSNR